MDELFDRIAGLKTPQKAGIVAALLFAMAGGYYYFFYAELLDETARNQAAIAEAQQEKEQYETRKREYQAFRLEVNQLLEEQKELLRMLPKKDDIEQFIEQVNAQVELAGLSKVSSIREQARSEQMYVRIPIRMSLVGSYHQINRFFKNIGELKRIVTISDLQLAPAEQNNARGPLKADFIAQTFQFQDKPGAVPAPPGGEQGEGGH